MQIINIFVTIEILKQNVSMKNKEMFLFFRKIKLLNKENEQFHSRRRINKTQILDYLYIINVFENAYRLCRCRRNVKTSSRERFS